MYKKIFGNRIKKNASKIRIVNISKVLTWRRTWKYSENLSQYSAVIFFVSSGSDKGLFVFTKSSPMLNFQEEEKIQFKI